MLRILKWVALALVLAIVVTAGVMWTSNNKDVARYTPAAAPAREAADDGVLIFGATRNTGFDVAELLVKRGEKVTAVVRPGSDDAALKALGVTVVPGDALDPESLKAALAGKNYRAVVTTIGCPRCAPPPDFLGNRNIFDAMKAAGAARVILVTTIGAGDSFYAAPWVARQALKKILPLKTEAEAHLKSLALDYTILRPGGLTKGPATGTGVLTEDTAGFGVISRAELARLIVACIDDPGTVGKTLSAFDAGLSYPFAFF